MQTWQCVVSAALAALSLAANAQSGPTQEELDHAQSSTEWLLPHHDYTGSRFVDLKQITDQYPRTLQLPKSFAVPATLTLPRHASLMIHFDKGGRQQALATLQTTMVRLLTNLPAGRVRRACTC